MLSRKLAKYQAARDVVVSKERTSSVTALVKCERQVFSEIKYITRKRRSALILIVLNRRSLLYMRTARVNAIRRRKRGSFV